MVVTSAMIMQDRRLIVRPEKREQNDRCGLYCNNDPNTERFIRFVNIALHALGDTAD